VSNDNERDDNERDDERDDNERDGNERDVDERDEATDSGEADAPEGAGESAPSSGLAASPEGPSSGPSVDASKGTRMSAGARLAAAKAAKSVAKAAKKEERKAAAQTNVVEEAAAEAPAAEAAPDDAVKQLEESELGRAALKAGRWWESNQRFGWVAIAAAALGIVGFLGWQYSRETTSAAAGELLEEALEIASAPIEDADAAGPDDEGENDERTFPTRSARDEAALEAYQAVLTHHPDHASAGIARLGAARTLLALGRNEEAQDMYQQAFDRNGGRSGTIAWQALEGVAFAQEAAGNTDEARATFERLGNLDDNAYEQVASYHLARLMLSRGERDEARTALRELVDALRAETVEDSSEPRFPYLLSQAEVRLRELDPSSATSAGPQLLGPGGGAPGEGGDIDPAQLQELIRQLQAQQGGGGGEGGGE
jgi:tetratricopeptide (TPR) repeat protein